MHFITSRLLRLYARNLTYEGKLVKTKPIPPILISAWKNSSHVGQLLKKKKKKDVQSPARNLLWTVGLGSLAHCPLPREKVTLCPEAVCMHTDGGHLCVLTSGIGLHKITNQPRNRRACPFMKCGVPPSFLNPLMPGLAGDGGLKCKWVPGRLLKMKLFCLGEVGGSYEMISE